MKIHEQEQLAAGRASVEKQEAREPRQQQQQSSPFELPFDLREWVSSDILQKWVKQEIDKLSWHETPFVDQFRSQSESRPRLLLGLLSLGHATRVFTSEGIVQACYLDPLFFLVWEGPVPLPQELRIFRGMNRHLLETILTGVFAQACGNRFKLDATRLMPDMKQDLRKQAIERLDIAHNMDGAVA